MRYLSVCAGIEAASVAWHNLGWEPVAFSEIEKFPSAVLAHHYPDTPNWGDMTKFKEWPNACRCVSNRHNELLGKTDGTFNGLGREECSAIYSEQGTSSCGGNRSSNKGHICEVCKGTSIDLLVGGTPCQSFSVAGLRKGLDDPRGNLMLVYLAIAAKYRPEWLVWENVPGVLSSNGGRDFASLLRGMAELGYGFAYRILDAQYFGVAQRRRRVFVVANARSWQRAAAVLFERHSLQGHPAPSREAGKGVASGLDVGVELCGTLGARDLAKHDIDGLSRNSAKMIPVVSCALNAGSMNRKDSETETFIPVAVQPVPYDFAQITAPVNRQNRKPGDPCHTLARDNAARATILQSYSFPWQQGAGQHGGLCKEHTMPLTKNQTLAVQQHIGGIDYEHNAHGMDEATGPLLKGSPTGGGRPLPAIATATQVRRLTPRECERLQGFPDDYTLISYRNKPARDGPRYKALGNSMAVPVMRWIGERIQKVSNINEEKSCTTTKSAQRNRNDTNGR